VSELLVIVPTRGRPESVGRVIDAWEDTDAFKQGAVLAFLVDADDPAVDDYQGAFELLEAPHMQASMHVMPAWLPLVPKLNRWAALLAEHQHFALGFAGDDHLPRTKGWVAAYLAALRDLRTGIVYGNDGIQGQRLPTQWAMTSDIIRALGRMVPADVEHLYCDNAVKDLGEAAGCLRYLPDVLIEHMHPVAGKAPMDAGYARVNRREQYRKDRLAYEKWRDRGLPDQAAMVRAVAAVRKEATWPV
jgi:hypothetical protein